MIRPFFGALGLAVLLAAPAGAQVNVEALRPGALRVGRSGTLGGDLSARVGNVDFVSVDLNARMYHVMEGQVRLLFASGGLGFLERSRFSSSGLFHFRTTYDEVVRHVQPEWYAQVNYDRATLLDFRLVAGAGARTSLGEGGRGSFGAGTSLMFEREWLELPDTALHPERTAEVRWSTFLSFRYEVGETTVLASTTYLQPALSDLGDYRALEDFQLSTRITDELALRVTLDLRYDSGPPDGLDALDGRLRTGVTYSY